MPRFLIILFTLIILCISGPAFTQKVNSTPDYLQQGKALVKSDPKKAIGLLEKAMRQAQIQHQNDRYLESLETLASINYTNLNEQNRVVAGWVKEGTHS